MKTPVKTKKNAHREVREMCENKQTLFDNISNISNKPLVKGIQEFC